MSCSKWAYDPDKCDFDYCPGDCDYCDKGTEINSNMLNNLLKKFPIPEGGQHIIMVKDHGRRQQKELLEKFRQLETILTGKKE